MKLGISCKGAVMKYGYEKALKLIKESGFDTVDVNLHTYWADEESVFYKSEDEFLSHFDYVKKLCNNLELEISQTHGMLTSCVPDKEESEHIKWGSEMEIAASAVLGAPVCVFHSVKGKQFEKISLDGDFLLQKNKEFFEFLSRACEKHNVKFAMETHGKTILETGAEMDFVGDVRNLRKSFDMINSDYKTFCLDTGHLNEIVQYGAMLPHEAIPVLGKDISCLHLHDNTGNRDSHLMPLPAAGGAVNWPEVFSALDEVGYSGVYNWELQLLNFGDILDEALPFIGRYLRYFTENKGHIKKQ